MPPQGWAPQGQQGWAPPPPAPKKSSGMLVAILAIVGSCCIVGMLVGKKPAPSGDQPAQVTTPAAPAAPAAPPSELANMPTFSATPDGRRDMARWIQQNQSMQMRRQFIVQERGQYNTTLFLVNASRCSPEAVREYMSTLALTPRLAEAGFVTAQCISPDSTAVSGSVVAYDISTSVISERRYAGCGWLRHSGGASTTAEREEIAESMRRIAARTRRQVSVSVEQDSVLVLRGMASCGDRALRVFLEDRQEGLHGRYMCSWGFTALRCYVGESLFELSPDQACSCAGASNESCECRWGQ